MASDWNLNNNKQRSGRIYFVATFKGEDVVISPTPMIPTDIPFQLKNCNFQFDWVHSHNKSFEMCGLDSYEIRFLHGELYVDSSPVNKPNTLFIYADNGKRKNVV